MFDILKEEIISIHEAAALFPGRQPGKALNFSTIWRWILKGVRAADGQLIRLEGVRLGARWVTSREAISRFAARLTPPTGTDAIAPIGTPSARKRANDATKKKLSELGI